ncbi:hypothetical protein [[Eubacterium] cellulosolvens]
MIKTKINLSSDQKRLLLLISRFTKPAKSRHEEEIWIKKIPLMALINRGINMNIFKTYDFSPTLVEYVDTMRYANISKEGEDDVADLRELGMVERLKLATSHYVYVSAYRITPKGLKYVATIEKVHHEAINRLLKCKQCSSQYDIEAREDAPYLICKNCKKAVKVAIFDLEEVSYVSKPRFSDLWLPQE